MVNLELTSIDEGFCRVNYRVKMKSAPGYAYFCIQDEGAYGVVPYRSTEDEEPQSEIKTDKCNFEMPCGHTELILKVRKFIMEVNKKNLE